MSDLDLGPIEARLATYQLWQAASDVRDLVAEVKRLAAALAAAQEREQRVVRLLDWTDETAAQMQHLPRLSTREVRAALAGEGAACTCPRRPEPLLADPACPLHGEGAADQPLTDEQHNYAAAHCDYRTTCPSAWHVHGCKRDDGKACTMPDEHKGAADQPRHCECDVPGGSTHRPWCPAFENLRTDKSCWHPQVDRSSLEAEAGVCPDCGLTVA